METRPTNLWSLTIVYDRDGISSHLFKSKQEALKYLCNLIHRVDFRKYLANCLVRFVRDRLVNDLDDDTPHPQQRVIDTWSDLTMCEFLDSVMVSDDLPVSDLSVLLHVYMKYDFNSSFPLNYVRQLENRPNLLELARLSSYLITGQPLPEKYHQVVLECCPLFADPFHENFYVGDSYDDLADHMYYQVSDESSGVYSGLADELIYSVSLEQAVLVENVE